MRKKTMYVFLSVLVLTAFASSLVLTSAKADDSLAAADDSLAAGQPGPLSTSAFCDVTVLTGDNWYIFGMATGGVGNYAYQWYQGTTMIAGQTSMLLLTANNVPGTYTYHLVVTDDAGSRATSNVVTITVIDP